MSFWNEIYKVKRQVLVGFGGGIDTYSDQTAIREDTLTDNKNMCSDEYPIIRVRNDRGITALPNTTSTIYGIGQRNYNSMHVLVNGVWKYGASSDSSWTNVNSTIANTNTAKFVEFNTQTDKYTVCAISRASSDTQYNSAWSSNSTTLEVSLSNDSPQTALYTAHKFRLYAIGNDGVTLYYSAQGDITDWVTALDAGYITLTEMKGRATAITTYADHVIIWSDNSMHELYGTYYQNYEVIDVSKDIGCVALHAHVECDEKLYWLDYDGIYMYTGGKPRKIALEAKKYIDGIDPDYKDLIQAGSVDGKIYFAIPYDSTAANTIIVVDTKHTDQYGNPQYLVNIEEGSFLGFTKNDGYLYGICSSGDIYNMRTTAKDGYDSTASTDSVISWSFETRALTNDEEIDTLTAIKDVWIQHQGTTEATLNVNYTTDSNSTTFVSYAVSTDLTHSTHIVRSRMLPTSTQLEGTAFMKFQVKGTGQKKISAMYINLLTYGEVG